MKINNNYMRFVREEIKKNADFARKIKNDVSVVRFNAHYDVRKKYVNKKLARRKIAVVSLWLMTATFLGLTFAQKSGTAGVAVTGMSGMVSMVSAVVAGELRGAYKGTNQRKSVRLLRNLNAKAREFLLKEEMRKEKEEIGVLKKEVVMLYEEKEMLNVNDKLVAKYSDELWSWFN